jgi:hypothetical protein
MAAVSGERLTTSDLLAVVPTPNYPGDTETYSQPNAGGRVEVSSDTVDNIELNFVDELGNDVLSMRNFIVTLVFDEIITQEVPSDQRIRLDKMRDEEMNLLRKRIRTSLHH